MVESPPASPKHSSGVLARGAYTNLLGMMGKLLLPVTFVVITRLFGPDTMGMFLLASMLLDMVANLTVSGINDGVLMLATRSDEDETAPGRDLYQILANGFAISLAIAVALVVFSRVGAPDLLAQYYRSEFDLAALVQVMALALPFRVISVVVIASTKVQMTMKWDALLNGFARSGFLLVACVVAYFVEPSLIGLAWAYVATWAAIGVIALFVFPVYYRYAALLRELGRLRLSGPLIRFAVPQNLNMAFSTFATNLDIVMLAYFQVAPALLGFYGIAAQIVRNVRQVKLIFSGAYAPMIVRLHMKGDTEGMNRTFSMVSRWAITIALPISLIIVFFRSELMQIFDSSFTGDTTFMLLLLVGPLLGCGVGLASNIVVMTGHSKWNLFNSLTAAAINTALNFLFIPRYGLTGAALATAISSIIVTSIRAIEARVLVGATLVPREIYKPLVAGLASATVPMLIFSFAPASGLLVQVAGCGVALGIYFGVLKTLGVAEEDMRALIPWKRS